MPWTNIPLSERPHYSEQQYPFHERSRFFEPDDARGRAILALREMLWEIDTDLPAPPVGLPGQPAPPKREVMAILSLGVEYLEAMASHQPRRQWNVYAEATRAIRELVQVGVDDYRQRARDEHLALHAHANTASAAEFIAREARSLVYFVREIKGGLSATRQTPNPSPIDPLNAGSAK